MQMMQMGHPLGFALADAMGFGRQGPASPPGMPAANPVGAPPPANSSAMQQPPAEAIPMPTDAQRPRMGRGQLIAGVLADALSGAMGRPGQFAEMMGQQRQREQAAQQEQVRWQRDRQGALEDFRSRQQIEQQYPAPSPMLRDVQAWQQMTPEQRTAYQTMQQARAGDPDVVVPLSNGQIYAGPRSGLAQALTGGAAPAGTAPTAPVGRLTPITDGGPTPPASAPFPVGETPVGSIPPGGW